MKFIVVFLVIASLSLSAAKPLQNNRETSARLQEDNSQKDEIGKIADPASLMSEASKDENASIQDIFQWINKLPTTHQCIVAFVIVFVFGVLLCDVAFYVWFFTSFRYRHERCRSKHAGNSYKVNESKVDNDIARIHSELFGPEGDDEEKLKELMKNPSKPRVTFADEKRPRKKPKMFLPQLSRKLSSILEDSSSGSEICSGDENNLLKEQRSSDSEASTMSTNISPAAEEANQSWFDNPLFDESQKIQPAEAEIKQPTGGWKESEV